MSVNYVIVKRKHYDIYSPHIYNDQFSKSFDNTQRNKKKIFKWPPVRVKSLFMPGCSTVSVLINVRDCAVSGIILSEGFNAMVNNLLFRTVYLHNLR